MAEELQEPPTDVDDQPAELDWKGFRLDEMGGQQVGKIAGTIVDEASRPWLLARMGRFGHYCLVPARDAVSANERVWVPYTREHIRRAPRVRPGDLPEGEDLEVILAHYGSV